MSCAPSGRATVIGPVRPANALARRLAEAWMLFPTEAQYVELLSRAGFADIELRTLAPTWYRGQGAYAVAVSGRKPAAGASPLALPPPAEPARAGVVRSSLRFAGGSLAGALFVPLAAALALRHRLQERHAR